MGKTPNSKLCSPKRPLTATKCLAPILVRHKKSKETNRKKTVRFNVPGAFSSSKKSEVKKCINCSISSQTRNIKDFLRSQSCISFEKLSPKCKTNAKIPSRRQTLSTTNCNTNSGSKEIHTGIDAATPFKNINDIAYLSSLSFLGKEEAKFPNGSHDDCGTRAAFSERTNYNSSNILNDSIRFGENEQPRPLGVHSEDEKKLENSNISPSLHSLSILIKDLSNVTMGGPAEEKGGEMKMARESQDNMNPCSVPSNSLVTLPMEEEDGLYLESMPIITNHDNSDNNNIFANLSNNASSGDENDNSANNGNESDLFDENDLSREMRRMRRVSTPVTTSMRVHRLDNAQEQMRHQSMNNVKSRSITDGSPDGTLLKCPILNCGLYFDDKDKFNFHVLQLNHNPCNSLAPLLNGVLPQVKCFLCPMCGITHQDPKMCHTHMQSDNHLPFMSPLPVRVFACPQCLSFFPSLGLAQEHIEVLAHNSFALSFKDDANRQTKVAPIPVPDRVVDIVTRMCNEVPHWLICVDSQETVTSVDQLVSLIKNKYLVVAKCDKSMTDIVSSLVTDQACAECLQMMIGCTSSSLCIHASCPKQGPVYAIEPRSMCSFIRRCGITDTATLSGDSPGWLTTVVEKEADLPTISNTKSEAGSQSLEQLPYLESFPSMPVTFPLVDAKAADDVSRGCEPYEHWVIYSVMDNSQSCSYNNCSDEESMASPLGLSTIKPEAILPRESESHLIVNINESVDSMGSNYESVGPSNCDLEYYENHPHRASAVSIPSQNSTPVYVPVDHPIWSSTAYEPEVIAHKAVLYPVKVIPSSATAKSRSGRLKMRHTFAYPRYSEMCRYSTCSCEQKDSINLPGPENRKRQRGANSCPSIEDDNMHCSITDSFMALEERSGFIWTDQFGSLYWLTTPERSLQVASENSLAGYAFRNGLSEERAAQQTDYDKKQSRSRKRKWILSSAAPECGDEHEQKKEDDDNFKETRRKCQDLAMHIVTMNENMLRNGNESQRSSAQHSAITLPGPSYRVISRRRDEATRLTSKVMLVENIVDGVYTNLVNNLESKGDSLDCVSDHPFQKYYSEETFHTGRNNLTLDSKYKNMSETFNDAVKHDQEGSSAESGGTPLIHRERCRFVSLSRDQSTSLSSERIESSVVDGSVYRSENVSFSLGMTERLSPSLKVSPQNTETCSLKDTETVMLSLSEEDTSCSLPGGECNHFSQFEGQRLLSNEETNVKGERSFEEIKEEDKSMPTSTALGCWRSECHDLHEKAHWQSLEAKYPFFIQTNPPFC